MPRKSSHVQSSQASTSSQNCTQLSQTRIDQHLVSSQVNIDDQTNNLVRYLVNNAGQNVYFRRADIQKHCASKAGQHFQQVVERATAILKNVYGYNVLVCDAQANSGKAYIVSNALPYINYNIEREDVEAKEVNKIILLLILTHIYMSNSAVTDASLHQFLKSFKIDVNVRHPVFGLVKDYITNTLIKQKFLNVESDPVSKKISYNWGIRAEKEISKHEILKFVCKIYKDRQPKSWMNQLRAAEEQVFENDRLLEGTRMDVDEE